MKLKLKQLSNPDDKDVLNLTLEDFEGPLDLLLYLAERGKIDILSLSMYEIVKQFQTYLSQFSYKNYDTISQYLEFASELIFLKAEEMLCKKDHSKKKLIDRVQEKKQIEEAAENLAALPVRGEDIFRAQLPIPEVAEPVPEEITLNDLILAMLPFAKKMQEQEKLKISEEKYTVADKKLEILKQSYLTSGHTINFKDTFSRTEGKAGAVAAFLATLDFVKDGVCDFEFREGSHNLKF